jgi:hypothetical protein
VAAKKLKKRASVTPWDYGNDVVRRHRALFDCAIIKNGKAADQVHDGIGQLWALDFLDGHGFDGVALRDAGRLFAQLWWERYAGADGSANLAPKVSSFERASRSSAIYDGMTKRDLLFEKLDDCLPSNSLERGAIIDLCVDPWYREGVTPWAHRLVCCELLKRKRIPEAMGFETSADRDKLAAAIRGLCALVDGALPQRWERRAA